MAFDFGGSKTDQKTVAPNNAVTVSDNGIAIVPRRTGNKSNNQANRSQTTYRLGKSASVNIYSTQLPGTSTTGSGVGGTGSGTGGTGSGVGSGDTTTPTSPSGTNNPEVDDSFFHTLASRFGLNADAAKDAEQTGKPSTLLHWVFLATVAVIVLGVITVIWKGRGSK